MNIKEGIEKLNPWFYRVKIGDEFTTPGIGSPNDTKYLLNRITYRQNLLLDRVCDMYDFKGKSVLDMGSNCGYWGSWYITSGAISYVGLEGRGISINQGHLYWGNNKFAEHDYTWEFQKFDANDCDLGEDTTDSVDFTLCAGLLYHIVDYRKFVMEVARVTKEVMVIDTRVEDVEQEVKEPGDLCFNALPDALTKTVPSLEGLLQCVADCGFISEVLTPPDVEVPRGLKGKDDYSKGNRVTVFCTRVS